MIPVIVKVIFIVILLVVICLLSALTEKDNDERKPQIKKEDENNTDPRFVYFNPNPTKTLDNKTGKAKNWNKGDCVVRAFSGVLELSWENVYSDLCRLGRAYNDFPNGDGIIDKYAKEKGLVKKRLQSPMTVSEFAETHNGVYFIKMRTHAVCVKDNMFYDCWDCGDNKIKYYYEKLGITEESSIAGTKICKAQYNTDSNEDIKNDPVVKAFCAVLDLPIEKVYSDLCRVGAELFDMPDSSKTVAHYAKEKGLVKKSLPSYMLLSEFAKSYDGTYLVHLNFATSCNVACVKDNKVIDDPDGYIGRSYKIRYYYEKL